MSDYESIEYDAMIARQEENYVKHKVTLRVTGLVTVEVYDNPDVNDDELIEQSDFNPGEIDVDWDDIEIVDHYTE